jgi:hypothetical protein
VQQREHTAEKDLKTNLISGGLVVELEDVPAVGDWLRSIHYRAQRAKFPLPCRA